jgi:hypothetical protein
MKYLNDLWYIYIYIYRYNDGAWTWISGSKIGNQNGNYGIKGMSSISNNPGSRRDLVNWIDNNGNFWIFGGRGNQGNPDTKIMFVS